MIPDLGADRRLLRLEGALDLAGDAGAGGKDRLPRRAGFPGAAQHVLLDAGDDLAGVKKRRWATSSAKLLSHAWSVPIRMEMAWSQTEARETDAYIATTAVQGRGERCPLLRLRRAVVDRA
jgi:hypothetical protein